VCIFAIAVFTTALFTGNTPVRQDIPSAVSLIALLVLVLLGGFLEALQIALFAVQHHNAKTTVSNHHARRTLGLVFEPSEGSKSNLQSFLVGRQILQTVIMFLIARIITVDMQEGADNLFGVSNGIQKLLESGILNALVSTIFASLSWRVTANAFPMIFLANPIAIWLMRLCWVVEGTGICDAAWLLASLHHRLVKYKPDQDILSRKDEDAAVNSEGDDDVEMGMEKTPNTAKILHSESTISMSSLSEIPSNDSMESV